MTDRREGFPPTPASSSTPVHDGGSEPLAVFRHYPVLEYYGETELLRRAVANARPMRKRSAPRWVAVMELFALGSTYAQQLCEHFDIDPEETVKR